ncbi:MAG: TatD family hydrolase [Magnetococcales bacterium]|nr:TatD family hydrolase [Magnetococcales bacterium]
MMIDTHCHIDNPAFDHDRQAVIQRAKEAGVNRLVVPGVSLDNFTSLPCEKDIKIHQALGLHPMFLDKHPQDAIEQLVKWIDRIKPIAIGEIGLDFREPHHNHNKQQELFSAQLQLAKLYQLPVLIHAVKAHDQIITTLKKADLPCGGIIHSFNGSLQQGQQYITMGFCLGFGGVVTHDRAKKIRTVAAKLPDSSLVLESDAPDLPPAGFAGKRNEPGYLTIVANTLASLRGVSTQHIIDATSMNAVNLLGIAND